MKEIVLKVTENKALLILVLVLIGGAYLITTNSYQGYGTASLDEGQELILTGCNALKMGPDEGVTEIVYPRYEHNNWRVHTSNFEEGFEDMTAHLLVYQTSCETLQLQAAKRKVLPFFVMSSTGDAACFAPTNSQCEAQKGTWKLRTVQYVERLFDVRTQQELVEIKQDFNSKIHNVINTNTNPQMSPGESWCVEILYQGVACECLEPQGQNECTILDSLRDL